jgi:hypothetical protein
MKSSFTALGFIAFTSVAASAMPGVQTVQYDRCDRPCQEHRREAARERERHHEYHHEEHHEGY